MTAILRAVGGDWITTEDGKHVFVKAKGFGFQLHKQVGAQAAPAPAKTIGEADQQLSKLQQKLNGHPNQKAISDAGLDAAAEAGKIGGALVQMNAQIDSLAQALAGSKEHVAQGKLDQMHGLVTGLLQEIADRAGRAGIDADALDQMELKALASANEQYGADQGAGTGHVAATLAAWAHAVAYIEKQVNQQVAEKAEARAGKAAGTEKGAGDKAPPTALEQLDAIKAKAKRAGLSDDAFFDLKAAAAQAADAAEMAAGKAGLEESDAEAEWNKTYFRTLNAGLAGAIAEKASQADAVTAPKPAKPDVSAKWKAAKQSSGLDEAEIAPIAEAMMDAWESTKTQHVAAGHDEQAAHEAGQADGLEIGLQMLGAAQSKKLSEASGQWYPVMAQAKAVGISGDEIDKLTGDVSDEIWKSFPAGLDTQGAMIADMGNSIKAYQAYAEKLKPLIEKKKAEIAKVKEQGAADADAAYNLHQQVKHQPGFDNHSALDKAGNLADKAAQQAKNAAIDAGQVTDAEHGDAIFNSAYHAKFAPLAKALLKKAPAEGEVAGNAEGAASKPGAPGPAAFTMWRWGKAEGSKGAGTFFSLKKHITAKAAENHNAELHEVSKTFQNVYTVGKEAHGEYAGSPSLAFIHEVAPKLNVAALAADWAGKLKLDGVHFGDWIAGHLAHALGYDAVHYEGNEVQDVSDFQPSAAWTGFSKKAGLEDLKKAPGAAEAPAKSEPAAKAEPAGPSPHAMLSDLMKDAGGGQTHDLSVHKLQSVKALADQQLDALHQQAAAAGLSSTELAELQAQAKTAGQKAFDAANAAGANPERAKRVRSLATSLALHQSLTEYVTPKAAAEPEKAPETAAPSAPHAMLADVMQQAGAKDLHDLSVHKLQAVKAATDAELDSLHQQATAAGLSGSALSGLQDAAKAAGQKAFAAAEAAGANPERAKRVRALATSLHLHESLTGYLDGQGVKPAAPAPAAKAEAKPAVAPAAAAAPAAPAAKLAAPASFVAKEILATKLAGQAGTNPGGLYESADGTQHYVKFYANAAQSHNEALANGLYNALGIAAPKSGTFEHEGKTAFASQIVPGKPLSEAGLTKETAHKILDGFVADAFLGNWDAIGKDLDNIKVGPDGKPVRIDNGGALLFRAQGGLKPEHALNDLSEWEHLGNAAKNPSYAKVFQAAGIQSPEQLGAKLGPQIDAVLNLGKQAGGWDKLVDKLAPGMDAGSKAKIAGMLTARAQILADKHPSITPEQKAAKAQAAYSQASAALQAAHKGFLAAVSEHGNHSSQAKSAAKGVLAAVPAAQKRNTALNHVPQPGYSPLEQTSSAMVGWYDQWKSKKAQLTSGQSDAVYGYADGIYKGLNKALRFADTGEGPALTGDQNKTVKALDESLHHVQYDADRIVWRGFGLSEMSAAALAPGAYFDDKGFVSCSSSHSFADGWSKAVGDPVKILAQVNVPKGTPHIPVRVWDSQHPGEYETVLPRDAKFMVHSVEKLPDGRLFVSMSVVDAPLKGKS